MPAGVAGLAMLVALTLVACDESDPAPAPDQGAASGDRDGDPRQSRRITVGCEGITPKPGWRRQTTSVRNFALFVKHLASQATELSNGNHLVKAGAAVVGNQPVTVRVPDALRGTVGLVYDVSQGRHRRPSEAWTQVTFMPCEGKPRSGYVGGLIFRGEPRDIALEVLLGGAIERLSLRR